MLTFEKKGTFQTVVKVDGKITGTINRVESSGFWRYTPKGHKVGSSFSGDVMRSELEVRKSLAV